MNELIPQDIKEAFAKRVADCPHPRELIVDALRLVQDHHGWVPDEGVTLVADLLHLSPLQVEEVATFYDKIFRQPVGKRVIHYCDSICCWSRGGEEIAAHLEHRLEISPGETTADGLFTLLPTCCLGACGEAPAMMIGMQTYGKLTKERIDKILEQERREEAS